MSLFFGTSPADEKLASNTRLQMTEPVMTCFSELPAEVRVIWAKSGTSGEQGHGLLAHMLDVAATAESLLAWEPPSTMQWVSRQLKMPPDQAVRWLVSMIGLHDFGKAVPGFQEKWPEGRLADEGAGFVFSQPACAVKQHSCATAALLRQPLSLAWPSISGDLLSAAVKAVSAHHGWHFLQQQVNAHAPRREPPVWGQARQALLDTYLSVLDVVDVPSVDVLSFSFINWLAGLTSAADWIASNPKWFPLGERKDDLCEYFAHSHALAEIALEEIGWAQFQALLVDDQPLQFLLEHMMGAASVSPRPLQMSGDRLLRNADGPALLIVEAPMGEGKTELAFLASLRLQQRNQHRGLYIAMPTQATGNAMFERALAFLTAFAQQHVDVQLAHGGAFLNDDLARLRLVDMQRLQGVNHSTAESVSASGWFGQRKRPLLSSYGVGTVDQALYAVLPVKHHFVNLWGLANRVVIFDEVHAYDAYTFDLIVALLRWLRRLGSSVVLMSATLPADRKQQFVSAWSEPAVVTVPEYDYPRMTLVDAKGVSGCGFAAQRRSVLYFGAVAEDLNAMAERAWALMRDEGCGAVIVNTVDRAQNLYRLLVAQLGRQVPIILFHARFPASQRAEIEQQVLGLFGPKGKRPRNALLVATQVAEQSLDLDFDFMLSDLAPIDLLLQRAGRLHRHERVRHRRHARARLWVAGLVPDRLPEMKETKWLYVYEPLILLRTWQVLKGLPVLQFPEDIDRYVQMVYDTPEDRVDELVHLISPKMMEDIQGEYLGRNQFRRQLARDIALDPREEASSAYAGRLQAQEIGDGKGVEAKTRLGPESVTVVPIWSGSTGWRVSRTGPAFDPQMPLSDGWARTLYSRQIKVSRQEVVKFFKAREPPASFADHPWLRDMHPLLLDQDGAAEGGLHIRLDDKLGLVFDTSPSHSL